MFGSVDGKDEAGVHGAGRVPVLDHGQDEADGPLGGNTGSVRGRWERSRRRSELEIDHAIGLELGEDGVGRNGEGGWGGEYAIEIGIEMGKESVG